MRSKQLTQKQQQVVDMFKNYKRLNGHYPTFAEVAKQLGVTHSVVRSHILLAEKKGVILDRHRIYKKQDQ